MPRTLSRRARLWCEPLEGRVTPAGTGLTAAYFDNADLTGQTATRVDAAVNFNYGTGAPAGGGGTSPDTFSVRWTGQVEPQFSETYTFTVRADDGVRLWVNDRLIVGRWSNSAAQDNAGSIALEGGQKYRVRLEYFEATGSASVQLSWASPSQPKQVVPQARLYPDSPADDRGSILQEYWTGVTGSTVASLTASANYPSRPTGRDYLTSLESPRGSSSWQDNFGVRVRGYLVPSTTGSYQFAVSGDNETRLLLNPNGTDPVGATTIAQMTTWSGFRQFDANPAQQQSAAVNLTAGRYYYVELLFKEGTGGDHYSVGWRAAGSSAAFQVVPGDNLVPFGTDAALPTQGSILNTLTSGGTRFLGGPQRIDLVKQQVAASPEAAGFYNAVKARADQLTATAAGGGYTVPLLAYTPDERGTILEVSREAVSRAYNLALAHKVTGGTAYAARLWAELNAVSNFPDWNADSHFLDTTEMTHAVGVGLDWLRDHWTAAQRDTLVTAIVNKGLMEGLNRHYRPNNGAGSGWARDTGNWTLVCNAGLAVGALAVGLENRSVAEEVLARAIPSARKAMGRYTADNGGWYESPGYWDYAVHYNVVMMAALESALGTDFGLARTPGLSHAGEFAMHITSPVNKNWNYGDGGTGAIRTVPMLWMARRFNEPAYADHVYDGTAPTSTFWGRGVLGLLWYTQDRAGPAAAGVPTADFFRGDTSALTSADVVTSRSAWDDGDATFVGFKAGRPMTGGHEQLDHGSFAFDALGQRWAEELGGDSYALPGYFSSGGRRLSYYRNRAEGQNTLVINPGASTHAYKAEQDYTKDTDVLIFNHDAVNNTTRAVADLTPVYGPAYAGPGVTKVWRGVARLGTDALVQDEITATTAAEVWWFMHIASANTVTFYRNGVADPGNDGGTEVVLTRGTDRLWLKVVDGPAGAEFSLKNAAPLPNFQFPAGTAENTNSAYRKLAIRLTGVTNARLAVFLAPLSPGETPPPSTPTLTPLADWGKPAGPVVAARSVAGGADQRSQVTAASVTFRGAVTFPAGPAAAFALTGPNGPVAVTPAAATVGGDTVVTLTFAPLADGEYTLRVPAGTVRDAAGGLLPADDAARFHRLYGDSDGDRDVDSDDFLQFLAVYDAPSSAFDTDGSGFVDSNDFLEFLGRYDTGL